MFTIPGTSLSIQAVQYYKRIDSSRKEAWLGSYKTVRLYKDLIALRMHKGGGNRFGRWFAIGEFVLKRSEYARSRALPQNYLFVDVCELKRNTILNIGRCSGILGHKGGRGQAEFIEGPDPVRRSLGSTWVDYYGNA